MPVSRERPELPRNSLVQFCMLRITQQVSADAAKQYYTSASADYYAEGQEIVGRWGGEGAKILGLEGTVSRRGFNALAENRNPTTGEQLTPRTKDERTVGYDFTWSVPKSVSLLYAMTEDEAILDAFREAAHVTMQDVEAEMKTRVRKKGRNEERVTGNLAYAEFVHFTSRPVGGLPDPQLHAHCFVFNATWDEQEQNWKAGQFRDLKRDAPFWQAAFRARLANRLQAMGYAIERKRDDFELAGVPSVEVTEIMRQEDARYKRAVRLLSEGSATEGFDELDRLGWVRQVPNAERYLTLAEAYLAAAAEPKRDGSLTQALVVSPTHAEGERITAVIRKELAARGRLKEEHELTAWVPLHLTEAERGDEGSYVPGDMIQFHQNAKGYKSGTRLRAGAAPLPLGQAARFQAYRAVTLQLAAGDRLRITANGKTADGKHRLNNGALYALKGFDKDGSIILDNGWVVSRDFGHIAYGYVVTSHASQGKTVDRVIIGQSSLSLPASDRQQLYVSVSRGKEQALIFTDDKQTLRQAVQRDRENMTASEVFRPEKESGWERLKKHLTFIRQCASLLTSSGKPDYERNQSRELYYER